MERKFLQSTRNPTTVLPNPIVLWAPAPFVVQQVQPPAAGLLVRRSSPASSFPRRSRSALVKLPPPLRLPKRTLLTLMPLCNSPPRGSGLTLLVLRGPTRPRSEATLPNRLMRAPLRLLWTPLPRPSSASSSLSHLPRLGRRAHRRRKTHTSIPCRIQSMKQARQTQHPMLIRSRCSSH